MAQDALYLNYGLPGMVKFPHPPSHWPLIEACWTYMKSCLLSKLYTFVWIGLHSTVFSFTGLCLLAVILPWVEHSSSCGKHVFGRNSYRWGALSILVQNVYIWVIIRDQLQFIVCSWSLMHHLDNLITFTMACLITCNNSAKHWTLVGWLYQAVYMRSRSLAACIHWA